MEKIQTVQGAMKPRRIIPDDGDAGDVSRPGSCYRQWRRVADVENPIAQKFITEAARLVTMSPERLVQAVFVIEGKIQKWVSKRRKGKERMDTDSE